MDRYELAAGVIELLEKPLLDEGYDLLDVRIFRGGGRLTLRIFLDRENGIDIKDIAKASRSVNYLLEEADLIQEAYVVEVSSPGVRRPMRLNRHYENAVQQDVILKVKGESRPRTIKGLLLAVTAESLEVRIKESDSPSETFRVGDILEANLDPELDVQALINADRRRHKEEKRQQRELRRQQKK
jgi:ribosome maturation factor RimP